MTSADKTFKVPVRQFVSFSCRSGDLDHTGPAGPSATEGQIAHRKLQSNRSKNEKAEVKVTADINIDDCLLRLSGRVDLLEDNPTTPRIGEIKSCYAPPHRLPASAVNMHWAQLKVYGYCWLRKMQTDNPDQPPPAISLRLIWFNVITDEITVDEVMFQFNSLEIFVIDAALKYVEWMQIIQAHQQQVKTSAQSLQFPHAGFRDGQRQMAAAVYVTARDKGTLLCEAPTGVGKTVSTLFPAVKAIGEGHIKNMAYLTAKNSGRVAANESILSLQSKGLIISAITITSKKTSCHCSNGTCERNSEGRCPLTIGFFDRLPKARLELIQTGVITPQIIDAAAHEHQVCPFELTLQMLPWVSIVICDYNYIFDPLVRLSHFMENASKYLLLIDEAHNLIDRSRSMYSAELDRFQIKRAISDGAGKADLLSNELVRVVRSIDRWATTSPEPESADKKTPATITRAVNKCTDALASTVENNQVLTESQADVAKELYRYLVIEDLFGDQHRTITSQKTIKKGRTKNRYVNVKLQCLNASEKLNHSFKQFRATVAFSATLRPMKFFRQSLGLPDTTAEMALPSPFDPEHQGTYICNWVDTRYQARERATQPIVDIAYEVYQAKRGNYQIFFPSYVFMETVYNAFTKKYPSIPTIIQERGSSQQQRTEFLSVFDNDNATLAFAIMGGIFGEGVDYIGNKLIGSIIVGTGLSSINLQQKLIEQDYVAQGLNGFDYGSRYPGLTRVLQTAGRVIRSEGDTGVVVLVDQRFGDSFYHDIFPDHWQVKNSVSVEALQSQLQEFWGVNFQLA